MGYFDQAVITAIQTGRLPVQPWWMKESQHRLLNLISSRRWDRKQGISCDFPRSPPACQENCGQFRRPAQKRRVHLLPIHQGYQVIAVIGALASQPRYQGAGSSSVNPAPVVQRPGWFPGMLWITTISRVIHSHRSSQAAPLKEAVVGARAGELPWSSPGCLQNSSPRALTGLPRQAMPDLHHELIEKVVDANPNTVVVLAGGSPVEMPWLPRVKAVLHLYLAGQAGRLAAVGSIDGKSQSSRETGRSYPRPYVDVPSAGFYEAGGKQAQYREGLLCWLPLL